jgi:glycosyltransferase involved in cell wall biosynthesis
MKTQDRQQKHRIAIDARLITDKVVGISRYSLNLILGILDKPDVELFCIVNTDHLYSELKRRGCHDRVSYIRTKSRPLSVLEHVEIPWLLVRYRIDLFHATSYMTPIWVPCKFVYSIHDTFHLIFPEGFSWIAKWYFKIVVKHAANRAKCIITMSKASKNDIEKYIIKKKQIHITYESYDNIHKTDKCIETLKIRYNIDRLGYFLFLGNHRVHKNFVRVIKAYTILQKKITNIPEMVMNLDEQMIKKSLNNNDEGTPGIRYTGFINEEDLYAIYKNALCLVVPSLYEGFGLFLLEAMDVGIPVITSNVSSIPEVAGDAALYVDPYDEDDIAWGMKRILEDVKLRSDLIMKGKEQINKFSWKKCTDETYKIYQAVLVGADLAVLGNK